MTEADLEVANAKVTRLTADLEARNIALDQANMELAAAKARMEEIQVEVGKVIPPKSIIFTDPLVPHADAEFQRIVQDEAQRLKEQTKNLLIEQILKWFYPQYSVKVEKDTMKVMTITVDNTFSLDTIKAEVKSLETTEWKTPSVPISTAGVSRGEERVVKGKLPSKTPVFQGKKTENIIDWFFRVESCFQMFNISENKDKLASLVNFVENDAFVILKMVSTDENLSERTFEKFKNKMLERFVNKNWRKIAKFELLDLSQTSSLDDYINKFRQKANLLYGVMSDTEMRDAFEKGVNGEAQFEIDKAKPESLEEAINIAVSLERCRKNKNKEIKISYTKNTSQNGRFNRSKRTPGQFGGPSGRNNGNNYHNQQKTTFVCHRCKQPGHFIKDCPITIQPNNQNAKPNVQNNNNNNNNRNNRNKNNNYNNNNKNITKRIYAVKTDNTKSSDDESDTSTTHVKCKVLSVKNNKLNCTPLLVMNPIIGDIQMEMAVDSGSECSVMSVNTAIKHGFKIKREKIEIRLADNTTASALGITDPLEVNLDGFVISVTFMLMEHTDHDGLLGADYFNSSGAMISISERCLIFPGKRVYEYTQKNGDEKVDIMALVNNVFDNEMADEELFESHDFKKDYPIKPESKLSDAEFRAFKKLIPLITNVSATAFEELGDCKLGEMVIETTTEIPIYMNPYRRSISDNKKIDFD